MDSLLSSAEDLSSRGKWTALCDLLDQSRQTITSLSAEQLDSALQPVAESGNNTLLWLALLTAKFCRNSDPPAIDWVRARGEFSSFVTRCQSDLVRNHRPHHFVDLCTAFTDLLLLSGPRGERGRRALSGVAPMLRAVSVASSGPGVLSCVHVLLCRLCLVSQCLRPALAVLDVDVTEISSELGRFTCQHLLLYYYYGGSLYAALGQHERAAHFLEIYYMVPAAVVSRVMVEAFKKHVLLTLIISGQSESQAPTARYHDALRSSVVRRLRPLCAPYVQLADAFSGSDNGDALATIVARHRADFERDNNWGLVLQCRAAHRRLAVQRLTRSFLTVSLSDAAARASLDDRDAAETHVRDMIASGAVSASIDQRLDMVRFLEAPRGRRRHELARRVCREMSLLMQLQRHLHSLDVQLQLDKQYVIKSGKRVDEESADQAGTAASSASGYEAATSSSSGSSRPLYANLM